MALMASSYGTPPVLGPPMTGAAVNVTCGQIVD